MLIRQILMVLQFIKTESFMRTIIMKKIIQELLFAKRKHAVYHEEELDADAEEYDFNDGYDKYNYYYLLYDL